jgi:hypothetical protein
VKLDFGYVDGVGLEKIVGMRMGRSRDGIGRGEEERREGRECGNGEVSFMKNMEGSSAQSSSRLINSLTNDT